MGMSRTVDNFLSLCITQTVVSTSIYIVNIAFAYICGILGKTNKLQERCLPLLIMKKNPVIIYLRLHWAKLLLIFFAASFVFILVSLMWFGFSGYIELESFSQRQMKTQMGMYIMMGIVQAIVFVAALGALHYYQMNGMLKNLGKDSAMEVKPNIKWDDVVGMEYAKRDAWEIVEFLRDQKKIKSIGGKIIKGTMFLGPPGCGKTYLAKAIATEVDLPFLSAVGSDFVGMLVGQGAARMKGLFKKARKLAKIYGGVIIFFDEIDSFATHRRADTGLGGGQTSHNATINQFLTELDGLRKTENNIVVFAATNSGEEELDAAIMRSGRFDRKIQVDYPGTRDREGLVKFYLNKIQHDSSCNPTILAKQTIWFSPADIDNLVREAAIFAQREKREVVSQKDLTKAKDHIIKILSKSGTRNIAFAQKQVHWDEIIGMDEVKKEVWDIITRMRNYRKSDTHTRLAKAYLLLGPPGTGKTHFVHAISTETMYPIIPLNPADLYAMDWHRAIGKVKRTFEEAKALNRTENGCILYIDNIDSLVWSDRDVSSNLLQNIFMSELDQILTGDNNIFVFGESTEQEDDLSDQLTKVSRFSQKIFFYRPGSEDRGRLLNKFLHKKAFAKDIEIEEIVRRTMWFSIVDLKSMITEAQLLSDKDDGIIRKNHFEKAIEKTINIIEKASGSFLMATRVDVQWKNVIGMDTAKKDAWEIVELLRDQKLLKLIGGKIIKGTLMTGPPGCGKTYLAKAIATEAQLPFLAVSGSEFVGIYVGTGAARMKKLFAEARALARAEKGCIIFIDEIDAFARHRQGLTGGGAGMSHNATINQFLTELDGLRKAENNIVCLAATNASEADLDSAITRSGRFERVIEVSYPNLKERKDLLEFYIQKVKYEEDINLGQLARRILWFTPANIDQLIREAGLLALRDKREKITAKDLSQAYDKIEYGNKSNLIQTPEQLEWTAYHEAAHAIVGYILHPSHDVVKATIIPRAGSLGFVAPRPRYEEYCKNREWFLAKIKTFVASYAGEMIKYGSTSSGVGGGPGSDFYVALSFAKTMVWRYGMGKSGLIGDFMAFTRYYANETYLSEKTRETLDDDVQLILQECLKECYDLLNEHRELFEYFAQELLAKQELEYDEIEAIFKKFNVKPKTRPPILDEIDE